MCALGPAPILVDDALRPLTPALLFSLDRRADPAPLGLTHDHALPKLEWWQENEPALWERAAWGLDATGFLVAQLTGVPVLDRISRGDWLLAGHPAPLPLPEPADPLEIAGGLRDRPARSLGVRPGTPVAVGTYDTYADALAAGVHVPGDACVLLGSTLVVGVAVAERLDVPGLASSDYLGEGSLLGGWTASAGSSLDWFARELGDAGRRLGPRARGGRAARPPVPRRRADSGLGSGRARRRPRPDPRDASRGALPSAPGRGRALGARSRRAAAHGGGHPRRMAGPRRRNPQRGMARRDLRRAGRPARGGRARDRSGRPRARGPACDRSRAHAAGARRVAARHRRAPRASTSSTRPTATLYPATAPLMRRLSENRA